MREVTQSTTKEIIAMLEQALVAEPEPAAAPPIPDHIRREQDEYDYDPPGFDPDEPTGNEPYYPDDDESDVVVEAEEAGEEPLMVPAPPLARPMIVSVLQENLKKALDIAAPYVPGYPPLPILANLLLEARDSRLHITATDLETSITACIGAKQEQAGAITIPAKTMKELIAVLSPERVDFRVDAAVDTMHVRCGVQTAELRGIDADEFPVIRHNEGAIDLVMQAESLLRMLDTVLKCAAKERNRPILCGVHMHLQPGRLVLMGADGYRLGVERLPVDYDGAEERLDLPDNAVKKLLRVLRGHKNMEVGITLPSERNSVTFTLPNIQVSTQLLEGRFPDALSILPRSFMSQAVMYAEDTRIALKRAAIFAKDNGNSCSLSVVPAWNPGEPAEVTISARSPERGETSAMLDATAEGERFEWSANYKFLQEAIEAYRKDAERIVIQTNGPENPAVIRPEIRPLESVGDCGSLTLIMPMSK